ncbi:MAG: RecQ family ATP-dependent DNA helicase [Firmicutes bacterium]|nr:RecQ family ATP-dependent DNA helicase [Bacillota bacterium]
MFENIVFVDTEVGVKDQRVHDAGACRFDGSVLHTKNPKEFASFIRSSEYICGHNVLRFDLPYIEKWTDSTISLKVIDTLYLSPLLFPKRPYHKLVKDDKLLVEQLNNPLNDSQRAMELFADEVNAFNSLNSALKRIFCVLLSDKEEFKGFFDYLNYRPFSIGIVSLIKRTFSGKICENTDIRSLLSNNPVELAFALALINADDRYSITPPWLLKNYPKLDYILNLLRNTPCNDPNCAYCRSTFDVNAGLKHIFGFDSFRKYNGEPLQEMAARAAVEGKSLLAVFPTGGGKSVTFQLPALMAGETTKGLTVVISPLQSLMKDQVDNLAGHGIVNAVTINGLLDPIERKQAVELVMNGTASLLYISPESLRSRTIEKLLISRNIVRFVIDEAHCFSAWGQDFRVDYLYIGKFIRRLQEKKASQEPIPVSCFTATAKQKVISDIRDYFRAELGVNLELFTTAAERENLHYSVMFEETDDSKYRTLRNLIEVKNCPTIVYVSRRARAEKLAERLTKDGFTALPYHAGMEPDDKIRTQEDFIENRVRIIVATSAFGMGVDKKDVRLVIHYDISDSLENYVQEAGRAGRDPSLEADCYVLYNNGDLDKHFLLLNQTKLSIGEIQQVWKAIKDLTRQRPVVSCSALEIARQAGWEDNAQTETLVRAAINALEYAGYVVRGQNVPRVYATSILTRNMVEASARINKSSVISGSDREKARRILSMLVATRSRANAGNDDAESRVDYIADRLGLTKAEVVESINLMRQERLLADEQDMSAFIMDGDTQNRSNMILKRFSNLEFFLLSKIPEEGFKANYKELNDEALKAGIQSSVKNIKTLFYYLTIKKYLEKVEDAENGSTYLMPVEPARILKAKASRRLDICSYIIDTLYGRVDRKSTSAEKPVGFSIVELYEGYKAVEGSLGQTPLTLSDIEDALLYLSKIGAMKIEGGFLVIYNGMEIHRKELNNAIQYKKDDYRQLDEFYKQRIQQIHIVGKYANLMVQDYDAALQYVADYFQMEYRAFLQKYFKGEEAKDINRNITPEKYKQLFDELSQVQRQIIDDHDSQYIVVAAGPGSGKTKVLVHKLASLLLLEDVKHEQLLMLTFSRAAATEFKMRLHELIGNASKRVDVKTFHSYCFDLLGKIGKLEDAEDVVKDATAYINDGEVEPEKITKKVLVIDEAQDMDANEFSLVEALIAHNEDLRVIAVGDDDQNIYEFRGSSSEYMNSLLTKYNARLYQLVDNYRSCPEIVSLANTYAQGMQKRMKDLPISAVRKDRGVVFFIRHHGSNFVEALVNDLESYYDNSGTVSILTNTNEEALMALGLLRRKNIPAKLIQTLNKFDLYQMLELRYLVDYIKGRAKSPVISEDLWDSAKAAMKERFEHSSNYDTCQQLMLSFEEAYPTKYLSDLEIFIRESKLEDFAEIRQGTVLVSTIHKSKGREFDSVYMLLNKVDDRTDKVKHQVYVGMTRAKSALHVHYNNNDFRYINIPGVYHSDDKKLYQDPAEITLQLDHTDIYLDQFFSTVSVTANLLPGEKLAVKENGFYAWSGGKIVRVGTFSKSFMSRLEKLNAKGYRVYSAKIRFVVLWKKQSDGKEYPEIPIVLPDVQLIRDVNM